MIHLPAESMVSVFPIGLTRLTEHRNQKIYDIFVNDVEERDEMRSLGRGRGNLMLSTRRCPLARCLGRNVHFVMGVKCILAREWMNGKGVGESGLMRLAKVGRMEGSQSSSPSFRSWMSLRTETLADIWLREMNGKLRRKDGS